MLATSQEQIEMRMTLANAETRTVQMNNQLKKIDDIVDKTEKLLYQMIPQNVAERLRKGVNPMDTVEVFESVTMLFSGMFNFMIGILLVGSSDSFTNIKFRIYNFFNEYCTVAYRVIKFKNFSHFDIETSTNSETTNPDSTEFLDQQKKF